MARSVWGTEAPIERKMVRGNSCAISAFAYPAPAPLFGSCHNQRSWRAADEWPAAQDGGGLVADQPAEKLIKIGAKVVSHGRYVTFQLAEVAVPRQMFVDILAL